MDRNEKAKRSRGRPIEKPMPGKIPDSPENIARAVFAVGKKAESEWRYLKEKST
jgi:hypothetical protein